VYKLKVTKIGNSLGVVIPKEMLSEGNFQIGDSLLAVKTVAGYELSRQNPDFDRQLEIAEAFMDRYRNTLAELAK